jgi:hypothetical protein
MLTRVLLALAILVGSAAGAFAAEPKVVALGLTDHATSKEEVANGEGLTEPGLKTGAVAYVLVEGVAEGDQVTVRLMNGEESLMHNVLTVEPGTERVFLQAGKTAVPAGGWPEGSYSAKLEIVSGGDMVVEQSSDPITLD